MKLYITQVPPNAGYAIVKALREALNSLGQQATNADANEVLKAINAQAGPYLLGDSAEHAAIKEARLILAEAGVRCAVDLPQAALDSLAAEEAAITRRSQDEPQVAEAISYRAAQFAMLALSMANGNAAMALHHCVLMARTAGETPEHRSVFSEAAGILLDTFPPTILNDIKEIIMHYTDLEEDDSYE